MIAAKYTSRKIFFIEYKTFFHRKQERHNRLFFYFYDWRSFCVSTSVAVVVLWKNKWDGQLFRFPAGSFFRKIFFRFCVYFSHFNTQMTVSTPKSSHYIKLMTWKIQSNLKSVSSHFTFQPPAILLRCWSAIKWPHVMKIWISHFSMMCRRVVLQ